MRDYAELVKALRVCGSAPYDCSDCPINPDECAGVMSLFSIAADAIEELLARDVVPTDFHERCLQLEIRKRIELEKQMPHWISVGERLPKKDEMVIVYYSWTGQSGTEYKEVSLATLEEMRYCGNKLLGWMPLPEPPKEVE